MSEVVSVLREDGTADPRRDPGLEMEDVVELYRSMRRARVVSARLESLSESGEIGFLPSIAGREAAVIGSVAALEQADWVFPTATDWPAALHRGMPIATMVRRVFAGGDDPLRGHDMPTAVSARAQRIASSSAPAATHLPHAVGVAYGAQRQGDHVLAAAFFDAHEVDAADFHTALNFAGVMRVPVLFICRVPGESEGAAEHAVAYGLDSARCDGSDLLAVVSTVREAASQRRPCVIDLCLAEGADPLARTRAHLEAVGAWSDAAEAETVTAVEEELSSAIAAARSGGALDPASLFEGVFATLPPHLERQRDELLVGNRPE